MRIIDADKLIADMESDFSCAHYPTYYTDIVDVQPTIDARSVIRGRWTRTKDLLGEDITVCSNCDEIMRQASGNYCAYCGADMRETDNGEV